MSFVARDFKRFFPAFYESFEKNVSTKINGQYILYSNLTFQNSYRNNIELSESVSGFEKSSVKSEKHQAKQNEMASYRLILKKLYVKRCCLLNLQD